MQKDPRSWSKDTMARPFTAASANSVLHTVKGSAVIKQTPLIPDIVLWATGGAR